jgi:hypothetical protein
MILSYCYVTGNISRVRKTRLYIMSPLNYTINIITNLVDIKIILRLDI